MAAAKKVGRGLRAACVVLFAASLQAATYCVTVAGLGGEPEYDQRFTTQANEIEKLLKSAGGETQVQTLQGAAATKAGLRAALDSIAKQAKPEDSLMLVLIGHGSFDGVEYKFNIPGPDVTSIELASMLDRVPVGRQLIVNATSSSGASLQALQKPTRTVITATKSGTEKNATAFTRYFVDALRDPAADTDKNEIITAQEAFKYAEQKTKQYYETNKRIATEHPVIDGEGARFAVLRIGSVQLAANDPAKKALLAKREDLEAQIDSLKLQKAAMPAAEYKQQLQNLLLELARTQAELDK